MPRSNLSPVVFAMLGAAVLTAGCAQLSRRQPAESRDACPRADLGEVDSDCPWAGWVRQAESGKISLSELPGVIAQSLELDAADSALHDAWGLSLNFDSGGRAEIVSQALLQELARRFGEKLTTENGITRQHAGLIHTYGYLLSNLRTPFGYKRARWVAGVADQGLGLPAQALGPVIQGQSTLLSRATALFMRVATHQDAAQAQAWSKRLAARSSPEIQALSLKGITRRKESYRLKTGETVDLVTDLVPLPQDPRSGKLLVYSVRQGAQIRLITGFPVDSKFQEKPGSPVRPRYNAWLE